MFISSSFKSQPSLLVIIIWSLSKLTPSLFDRFFKIHKFIDSTNSVSIDPLTNKDPPIKSKSGLNSLATKITYPLVLVLNSHTNPSLINDFKELVTSP